MMCWRRHCLTVYCITPRLSPLMAAVIGCVSAWRPIRWNGRPTGWVKNRRRSWTARAGELGQSRLAQVGQKPSAIWVKSKSALTSCLRCQHIHANQGCLTQQFGLARTFGILCEQLPNMHQLLWCEPNPFGDREACFLQGGWLCVHPYFFAAINRTENSAPTELSAEARSRFTRK